MLSEYNRNIKRMEERVRDAENRAANASLEVAKQLGKARQLLHTTHTTPFDRKGPLNDNTNAKSHE